MARMYAYAAQVMQERGAGLIYMLPDRKWMRLLRLMPSSFAAKFELWTMPLPMPASLPATQGCTVEPLDLSRHDVDALWRTGSPFFRPLVVRDSAALPRRFGGDEAVVVRQGADVCGVASFRLQGRTKFQFLIADLLAADNEDALRPTLEAVYNLAHARALAAELDKPIVKIAILVTPVIEPVVRTLGFQPADYFYPLFVHVLDASIAAQSADAAHWYITAND